MGVEFRLDSTVDRITASSGRIAGVMVSGPAGSQLLTADAYVVALGSYTPLLLRPLGVRLPVIPAKGYSATVPLSTAALAPTVSLTDEAMKIVFSRLGNRMRIAGTAELDGYSTNLSIIRTEALVRRAIELGARRARPGLVAATVAVCLPRRPPPGPRRRRL